MAERNLAEGSTRGINAGNLSQSVARARAGKVRHSSVVLARAFKDAITAAADTWKRDDRDQYQGRKQQATTDRPFDKDRKVPARQVHGSSKILLKQWPDHK